MGVRKGSSRIAIVMPRLGIVIKLPRIGARGAAQNLKRMWRKPSRIRTELLRSTHDSVYSLKWWLFRGFFDNLHEWDFYRKTRHPICEPTYVSLAGIVNVQKCGSTLEMDQMAFSNAMRELLGEEDFWKDAHHFSQPRNFCMDNGTISIADYANRRTQWLIRKHGQRLATDFPRLVPA